MDEKIKSAIDATLTEHYTAEDGYEDRTAALFGLLVDVGRQYLEAITPDNASTLGGILEDPVLGLEENLRIDEGDTPDPEVTAPAAA